MREIQPQGSGVQAERTEELTDCSYALSRESLTAKFIYKWSLGLEIDSHSFVSVALIQHLMCAKNCASRQGQGGQGAKRGLWGR